jgi:hypothetical protein
LLPRNISGIFPPLPPNNLYDVTLDNIHPDNSDSDISINKDADFQQVDSDMGSGNGSGSDYGSDADMSIYFHPRLVFKKLTFRDVKRSIDKYYISDNSKYSNVLDILITYLKGQKTLFIYSKNSTQVKLNLLIIPSIIFTAAITIFAPFVQSYVWSGALISALNAMITLLISVSSYLRLETAVEMYSQVANQYDKLEASLSTTNNKLLFIENTHEYDELVFIKLKEFEKKMNEIKGICPLFISEEVNLLFPVISHISIFTLIKKLEFYKKTLLLRLKDVKNEIRYILYKYSVCSYRNTDKTNIIDIREKFRNNIRIQYLFEAKEKLKEELIQYKSAYGYIDEIFSREINLAEIETKRKSGIYGICNGLLFRHKKTLRYNTGNMVIDKHLNFIFSDHQ